MRVTIEAGGVATIDFCTRLPGREGGGCTWGEESWRTRRGAERREGEAEAEVRVT
jgi:hypothetical protein